MGKNGNIIELNGKQYDALTGKMLSAVQNTAPSNHIAGGQVVDGFIAPANHASSHHSKLKLPTAPKPTEPLVAMTKKPLMDIARPAPHKIAHHAPKKSETLMRSVVAKPEPSIKRHAKAASHSHAVLQQPKFQIIKKLAHPKIDPKRSQRSSHIAQSELIQRFVPQTATPPQPTPKVPTPEIKPVHAETPAAHAVAQPSAAASSLDIFERALQRANSHMELPPESKSKKRAAGRPSKHGKEMSTRKKRILSFGGATFAALLLVGFFVVQNQANLTVKYASAKAGFSATIPSYKPEGFAVGKFNYSAGQVAIVYKSTLTDQTFSLVQKQSKMDSTSLGSDYVATKDPDYKTVSSAGQTIYIYGQNNATWVSGGVWYDLDSAGSLSTKELVSLANSI